VLGASFEGYEEELTEILQDIEERRKRKVGMDDAGKKAMKSRVKRSRKLKNLVSSINYEGRSAKNRGQREGYAIVFMQLKIFSWNVRGLNDKDKSLRVCHLLNL
jgi:hypothetical protein